MQIKCSKFNGTGHIDFEFSPKEFGAQQVLHPEMETYLNRFKKKMLLSAIVPIIEKYKLDKFNFSVEFHEETRKFPGLQDQQLLIMRGLLDAEQSAANDSGDRR